MSNVTALRRPGDPSIRELFTRLVKADAEVMQAEQAADDASAVLEAAKDRREDVANTIAVLRRSVTRAYAAGRVYVIDPGHHPTLRNVVSVQTVKDLEAAT